MNGKTARAIRKGMGVDVTAKANPQVAKVTDKIEYVNTPEGLKAISVRRFTFINMTKYTYRKAKKAFLRGEL